MKDDDVIKVTNFELLRILAGNSLTFNSKEGNRVVIRLSTPDELMAANREAIADSDIPPMTRTLALQLTRAVDVEKLLR